MTIVFLNSVFRYSTFKNDLGIEQGWTFTCSISIFQVKPLMAGQASQARKNERNDLFGVQLEVCSSAVFSQLMVTLSFRNYPLDTPIETQNTPADLSGKGTS